MPSPAATPLSAPPVPSNRITSHHPAKQIQRGYVGLTEAATYLDVTTKTVRKLIASGDLPAYRLGTHVLKVKISDLDAVLKPYGGAA